MITVPTEKGEEMANKKCPVCGGECVAVGVFKRFDGEVAEMRWHIICHDCGYNHKGDADGTLEDAVHEFYTKLGAEENWGVIRSQIKQRLHKTTTNAEMNNGKYWRWIRGLYRAEAVVRCENCKWYAETEDEEMNVYPTCEHPEEGGGWTRGKDWFCADGEPKEENNG